MMQVLTFKIFGFRRHFHLLQTFPASLSSKHYKVILSKSCRCLVISSITVRLIHSKWDKLLHTAKLLAPFHVYLNQVCFLFLFDGRCVQLEATQRPSQAMHVINSAWSRQLGRDDALTEGHDQRRNQKIYFGEAEADRISRITDCNFTVRMLYRNIY